MSTYTRHILERVLLVIGLALAIWGWKWTSISIAPYNVQDDGYNVTGGFLMLIGGILIGRYLTVRTSAKAPVERKRK